LRSRGPHSEATLDRSPLVIASRLRATELATYARRHALVAAGLLSATAVVLLATRFAISGSWTYRFLAWNIALAAAPAWAAMLAAACMRTRLSRLALPLVLVALAFLPNAPYLITDLVHLRHRPPVPLWFDIALLSSFGAAGLTLGAAALSMIHELCRRALGRNVARAVTVAALATSGLGIYIGRFLRWNSWDLVSNPLRVGSVLFQAVVHPFAHPRTWGVAILYGGLMTVCYLAFLSVRGGRDGRAARESRA